MEDILRAYLRSIYQLRVEEENALLQAWQPVSVKRKTMLTVAGERERYLYFVLEGIQRAFYLTPDNREVTIVFTYPHSFSGVADSFLTRTESAYFLETLTASTLLRISHEELSRLMKTYPGIQELILMATAQVLKGILLRQVELQCFRNEEKFRALLKRSPHILNLVPHKYLASYLGMDTTNFSKLYNTIRI